MSLYRRLAGCVAAIMLAGAGCTQGPGLPRRPAEADSPVRFRDVTLERGIDFAFEPSDPAHLNIVQISTGGAGFLDHDGDGDLDLILVGLSRCALYENDGQGHFRDVTVRAGLGKPAAWMGCAVADYDNDGRPDLLLTGYNAIRLYHNASGRFVDVTGGSGLAVDRWYTSAVFADFNRDGNLDLYVGAYAEFGPNSPQHCTVGLDPQGVAVTGPCGPEPYPAQRGRLYLGQGEGRFRDVTAAAGLTGATGKTLGVAVCDFDDDGDEDLYLANDRVAGDLFENLGDSGGIPHFRNVGERSGTAYNRSGGVQGGMGVDWGDYDNDGRFDLFVGTYQNEAKSLYRNLGRGLFQDMSASAGLTPAQPYVAFGTRWLDADNDGWLDLMSVNGHVLGPAERVDPSLSFAQPVQLFHNRGDGTFEDLSHRAGDISTRRIVGRALAVGDIDNDGRVDALATDIQGRPCLFHNVSDTGHHWLRVRLQGVKSNRAGIGARITLEAAGRKQMREITTGGSYLSAGDPRALFGIGAASSARLTVRWPSGIVSQVQALQVDREIVIRELR